MSPEQLEECAVEAAIPAMGYVARMRLYLRERFPLAAHSVLILSFYSSNQFLAHALAAPGAPMRYDLGSLAGGLTLLCFFLHLRIFDDHKDYEEDRRHFPDRALSRGVVTLGELKVLAAAAIALELALAAWRGPAALAAVLLALGYSVLMLKEFFARDWLRRRFFLYATLHLLIVPCLSLVVFSFATGRWFWEAPRWYWLYACVGFFVAFNWEISRKIRAPEEEIEGVDSYTRRFGLYGAAWLVLWVRAIDTALVTIVGLHLDLSIWFYAVLFLLFAICAIGFLEYRLHTTPRTARRMETYAGFYIFAFDVTLAVALARTYGIDFFGWQG
jgi:4-hydroxybenzoate polyprenyltransferase